MQIVDIEKNQKNQSEFIGKTRRGKICFFNKKATQELIEWRKWFFNEYFGGEEHVYFAQTYKERDNYVVVNSLMTKKEIKTNFLSIAETVVEGKLAVIKNACSCRLCGGTYVPNWICDYKAGARHPRAYFYLTPLTHEYLTASEVAKCKIDKNVIFVDKDSPHGCYKWIEHQKVLFKKV